MKGRTLEEALMYAKIVKDGGHDHCRMCEDPQDDGDRRHSERYKAQLEAAAFCVILADEVGRLRRGNRLGD